MISLRGVSLTYPNGVRALDHVSLEITKGDFVFLVGHSGTGKSSLLRLLYREAKPTAGEIVVDGIRVDKLHRGRIPALRRHLGVVFQDFKLLTDKTVWENVAFAMQVTGAHTKDVMRQVPRVLDLVGLSHKSRMYPGELSGGEQRRTAIGALVNNPRPAFPNRPEISIRRTRPKSWSCCSESTSAGRPSWSLLTTRPSSTACVAASCVWKMDGSSPTKNGLLYL